MRFAFDEDVSRPLAALLRFHGYEAASAKELARLRLRDPQVLTAATEAGQVLVTHNAKDFIVLHEAWLAWKFRWERELTESGISFALSSHAGIAVVPHRPDPDLVHLLSALADTYPSIDERLFTWTEAQDWSEIFF